MIKNVKRLPKNSFVATVYNEEDSIDVLINSLFAQTIRPDEIIIVDGGSTDRTIEYIQKYEGKIKFFVKEGNRAKGRNFAIERARGDIILSSDAGCILDKNWVKNILLSFKNTKVDVVAGYYKGMAENVFQKSLIPYVLVMPDRLNKNDFLPASRSMGLKKSIWKKVGGFPEKYSYNEDYVFAKRLKGINVNIIFSKNAIVNWIPRKNFNEAFIMFYKFAYGDIQSGILRPKVSLIFFRYILGIVILFASFLLYPWAIFFLISALFFYIIWAILKNYRYVNDYRAIILLPALQFTSDFAVMLGSIVALGGRK